MADEYISPSETQVYGPFAIDQMREVVAGLVPELDAAVQFAIKAQKRADKDMAVAIERHPAPAPPPDKDALVAEAADTIVRFGKHIESHKGRPVSNAVFFGQDAPSIVGRRRLTKLVGAVKHIAEKIESHKDKIREHELWLGEFRSLHERLAVLERASRASRVEQADLGSELAAARERWLAVYNANKALVAGVLRHGDKLQLLPLVFDDLAETHRAVGVTDEPPAGAQTPGSAAPSA